MAHPSLVCSKQCGQGHARAAKPSVAGHGSLMGPVRSIDDSQKPQPNAAGWCPSLLRYGGSGRGPLVDHDQDLIGEGPMTRLRHRAGAWPPSSLPFRLRVTPRRQTYPGKPVRIVRLDWPGRFSSTSLPAFFATKFSEKDRPSPSRSRTLPAPAASWRPDRVAKVAAGRIRAAGEQPGPGHRRPTPRQEQLRPALPISRRSPCWQRRRPVSRSTAPCRSRPSRNSWPMPALGRVR